MAHALACSAPVVEAGACRVLTGGVAADSLIMHLSQADRVQVKSRTRVEDQVKDQIKGQVGTGQHRSRHK